MKTLSLCSGIGGLELALPQAQPVAIAETGPAPSRLLAEHWPHIPNLGDWTQLATLDELAPELITGGLPCQPISRAGRRKGEQDNRWLFDELLDLLDRSKTRPWLFLENVAAITDANHRTGYFRLLDGLRTRNYHAETRIVSAAQIGAPHLRRRWFLLASPHPRPAPRLQLNSPQNGNRPALPTPTATGKPSSNPDFSPDLADLTRNHHPLLTTPTASLGPSSPNRNNPQLADLTGNHQPPQKTPDIPRTSRQPNTAAKQYLADLPDSQGRIHNWKKYAPAIQQWEQVCCPGQR